MLQETITNEFSSSGFNFEFVTGDNITLWDEKVYEKKTRETLGAYWINEFD